MSIEPVLNIKKLTMTPHAHRRTVERFNCKDDFKESLNFVKNILGTHCTKFVAKTTCELGNEAYMYSNGNTAIYISTDLLSIKTVIDLRERFRHYSPVKSKIKKMYEKEFRKIQVTENARIKRLEYIKIKENVDIAPIQLRMVKTRSQTVKNFCKEQIVLLSMESRKLEKEILEIQSNRRIIVKALATVIS